MAKNNKKSLDDFYDKIDIQSNRVAAQISKAMIIPGLTPKASLIIYISAICKTTQAIALIAGMNPQKVGEAISESISSYFEMGGDPRLNDLVTHIKNLN